MGLGIWSDESGVTLTIHARRSLETKQRKQPTVISRLHQRGFNTVLIRLNCTAEPKGKLIPRFELHRSNKITGYTESVQFARVFVFLSQSSEQYLYPIVKIQIENDSIRLRCDKCFFENICECVFLCIFGSTFAANSAQPYGCGEHRYTR